MNALGRLFLIACLGCACLHAFAQQDGEEASSKFDERIRMTVHVVSEDDRAVSQTLRVRLMYQRDLATLVTVTTNGEGVAEFNVPRTGNFLIEVSGSGIVTTTSDPFALTHYDRSSQQYIRVKLKDAAATAAPPATGVASAKEFSVPKDAEKEFDSGVASMRAGEWQRAQEHFQIAIDRYPRFDQAYDDLGIAKQNGGDIAGAKVAYRKAIELNDHNADAERNLARVLEGEKDWPAAAELLTKSLGVEPNHAGSLTLLAMAQLQQGKVDEAIASASRVHALEHKSYALAHLVLARAYEMKGRNPDAIAEYKLFLTEEPNGPRSDAARKKLASLQPPS